MSSLKGIAGSCAKSSIPKAEGDEMSLLLSSAAVPVHARGLQRSTNMIYVFGWDSAKLSSFAHAGRALRGCLNKSRQMAGLSRYENK